MKAVRIPVFNPVLFTQRIADTIAKEGGDPAVRDTLVRLRGARELRESPEEHVDHAMLMLWAFNRWRAASNKVLNKSPSFYSPRVYVKIDDGVTMQMFQMHLPGLDSWKVLRSKVRANFIKSMDRGDSYINKWCADLVAHPDLSALGDLQRDLYGYVETPSDAAPFAGVAPEADDGDPEDT